MELAESLKEFIKEGQDWERKETSVKGVAIIRLPQNKNMPASLAIDINPLKENGLPMKKKSIMIRDAAELNVYEYMAKPFHNATVVKIIKEAVASKGEDE